MSVVLAGSLLALGTAGGGASALSTEVPAPWVGASAGSPADPAAARRLWTETNEQIGGGRLTHRRSFDPTIPVVGREAWRDTDARYQFYSVKPPGDDVAGFIAGEYDDELRAVASELPAGTKFTVYHEPEDDMSGETFRQVMAKTVAVVKAANPGAEVWYVAMAYQWRTNSKGNVDTNAGWIDAARLADAVGIDVYAPNWYYHSIRDDAGFQRWWDEIRTPSGKPWGVVERGISNIPGEDARITLLRDDWALAREREATLFLYWNVGDPQLTGAREQAAAREIAVQGRQ